MVLSLYLPLVLVSALVGTGLALFAWLHSDAPGAKPLSLFMLAASLWSVTTGVSLASPDPESTVFWMKLTLSLSTVVPLAWILTVLEYTGSDEWLTSRTLFALLLEPVAVVGLIWTNPLHHWVWSDISTHQIGPFVAFAATREPGFWVHMAYSYLLIAIGALLLIQLLIRGHRLYRAQSTALLAAIAIPTVANVLYISGIFPVGMDPTGVSFVFTGGVIAVAILREQLLGIAPAAREAGREELIAEMDDEVFIVDDARVLIDVNRAAEAFLGEPNEELIGRSLSAILPELDAVLADVADATEHDVSFERDGELRHYSVRVSSLDRAYGAITGSIISLRDVTDRHQREQRLDVLNRLLRHNLRNEMNVVRGNAELLDAEIDDPDLLDRVSTITQTVDTVIERSNKVGALSKLDEMNRRPIDVSRLLTELVTAVRREYPTVDLSYQDATADEILVNASPSLRLAFDELLENAIEHNDSTIPVVDVRLDCDTNDRYVTITISDNGPGIDRQEQIVIDEGRETPLQHGSGVGLWLVSWTVHRFGGSIEFDVDDDGSTVTVCLPRHTNDDPE